MNDIMTLRVQEFQEYVQKLHEAGKLVDENVAKMQKFQQQLKKVSFDKARASANAFNKTLHTMNKIIEAIQNKAKTITFIGMGAVTGIGAWGQEINKSNSEASAKGLSPRQQYSLKGAAQIMGNDENYFVDMYSKLDEARKDWANSSKYFSQLGIKDIQSLEDIKDPRELIHKVVSEIQKNKKEGKLDFKGNAKLIDDSVENLLGVNLQEALSIDVKDFNAKYKDSFNNVTDEELKRMGKMGSEFTSLFQTIKNFALSVTSNLAPALSKLFKAVLPFITRFLVIFAFHFTKLIFFKYYPVIVNLGLFIVFFSSCLFFIVFSSVFRITSVNFSGVSKAYPWACSIIFLVCLYIASFALPLIPVLCNLPRGETIY